MGSVAVGIDLGTTNSCVAVYKDGKVEIIQNKEGSYVVPSCVAFTDDGIITGHEAKNEAHQYVQNTIFEIKRLIGQRIDDQKVKEHIQRFPFQVNNDNGIPQIEVTCKGKTEKYFPQEISAFTLKELKTLAETQLKQDISQVVVTVPAYFNDFQRQATKDAATIAGFKKVNIINEPTAAALSFTYQNAKPYKRNVLVYDFGGGTFDVSIVTVGRGKCEVKATKGDLYLGGTDIDMNLVNFVKEDFITQFGEEIQEDDVVRRRLKNACELAKTRLSGEKRKIEIELNNLSGKDYIASITREEFEEINADLFEDTLNVVKECLENSQLTKDDIDEVVLVGGSSRIPKVQEMLENYFGHDKINQGVNPDEAVAYGAAIHATNLVGNKEVVTDVISLSLGIAILGFFNSVIIPSNTSIPTQYTKRHQTLRDNQVAAEIIVYQGESELVENNFELGRFTLTGLRMAPAGDVQIDVCFEVDSEGILNVTASEVDAHNVHSIEIDVKRRGLSPNQIEHRIAELQQHSEDQMRRRKFFAAKYELEELCNTVTNNSRQIKNDDARSAILSTCEDICKWLQDISIDDSNGIELKKDVIMKLFKDGILEDPVTD